MADFNLGTARGKIEIDSSGVDSGVRSAKGSVGDLEGQSAKAQASLTKTGAVMGGLGLAVVAGFGLAVGAASNFETRMSAVKAVSGATGEEMEAIRAKALKLGADTAFSASEAGSAIEELVKAGIPLKGVIDGAADATVALAAAGEIDLPEAATIAANAMNQFGLSAEQMPKIADLIAGAANASAIDVSEFGMSMSQAGATANLVGLSFDDMAVAIAAMGNAGIKGSDAGTSLKTFLSNLQPVTDKQTALFKDLGLVTDDNAGKLTNLSGVVETQEGVAGKLLNTFKVAPKMFEEIGLGINKAGTGFTDATGKAITFEAAQAKLRGGGAKVVKLMEDVGIKVAAGGNAFFDASGKIKSMSEISQILQDSLKGQTEQQKAATLEALFGSDAIRAAAIISENGAEGFDKLAASMGKTTAADVAKTRMDNLGGSLEQMKGSIETAAIQIGSVLLPIIRKFIDGITKLVNMFGAMPGPLQKVIVIGGLLLGVLVGLTGAAMLGAVGVMKLKKGYEDMKKVMELMKLATIKHTVAEKARQAVTKVGTAIQWAFNAAMTANPIFAVIAAVVLIGAALFLLYKKFKPFRDLIDSIWQGIQVAFDFIKGIIGGFLGWIKTNWDLLLPIFLGPIGIIIIVVRRFGDDIVGFFKDMVKKVFNVAKGIFDFLIEKATGAKDWIFEKIGEIVGFFIALPGRIVSAVGDIFWFLIEKATALKDWIWQRIQDIVGFYIGLPGRLVNAVGDIFRFLIDKATAVKDWIWHRIGDIVHFFWELPGRVANVAGNVFHFLFDKINAAKDWIFHRVNDIFNIFWELPGRLARGAGNIFSFIADSFRGAINWVIRKWNDLSFRIGGQSVFGVTLPGVTIDTPNIPLMHSGGGTTKDVLAQLQAGEFVLRKSAAAALGSGVLQTLNTGKLPNSGGVTIEEITINNPVGETAEQSLTRTMQKLEYAGYFG